MPDYFNKFPKINYNFRYTDKNGNSIEETKTMVNISVKYALSREGRLSAGAFYPYSWKEGDRPDILSEKYYGSNDLFWLVMYGSQTFDVFNEFPKNENAFYDYLYRKYKTDAIDAGYSDTVESVVAYTKVTVHSYRDSDGDTIDLQTYTITPGDRSIVYLFDFEEEENQKLRNVRVVSSEFSDRIRTEFEDKLNQLNKDLENGT